MGPQTRHGLCSNRPLETRYLLSPLTSSEPPGKQAQPRTENGRQRGKETGRGENTSGSASWAVPTGPRSKRPGLLRSQPPSKRQALPGAAECSQPTEPPSDSLKA